MGLTRPRAEQIYNLDYKQATRVVATTNIILAGGAPSQVDGVNLSTNDRILVTGQTTSSQNGLYDVTTVGSGSNGTWVRTTDANSTGEIDAGMIVMVTEGAVYHDTQWKLITDNPITIDSTALVFTQNYSANSISGGTSNVTVYSNANVTISSAGTPNVLTVSSTGTVTSGTASVTGNITGGNIITSGQVSATGNLSGNYLLANIAYATGYTASRIYNGISEVNIATANGNANISINGTSNVAVFASTGQYVTGNISATGNVTAANVLGNTNAFGTIVANGQSNINATVNNQTLTLATSAGSGLAWVTDTANNILTLDQTSTGGSIFATGGDMGLVTDAVTTSEDLGSVADTYTVAYDLGSVIDASGLIYPSQLVLPAYTAEILPGANPPGQFVFLSNSSVGAMTAFSDGTNWRFTSSGNIVS